ncbi:lipid II flippase MurJ [Ferrovum myxofaciens]|uniref:lipid II flippase MurJ n=1 Tax=Ferrovum myxofaciens TaxID=416213 RepID=UPI003EBB1F7C
MRKSAIFVSAFFLDRASYAGLLALMTFLFGISEQTDIYFIVVLVPIFIVNISNEISFVTIMQALSQINDETNQWKTVGKLLIFFVLLYLILTISLIFFSKPLMDILGSSLTPNAKQQAVELQRISAILILANGVGAVGGNVLMRLGYSMLGAMRMPLTTILGFIASVAIYFTFEKSIWAFVAGGTLAAIVISMAFFLKLYFVKGDNHLFNRQSLNLFPLAAFFVSIFYNTLTNLGHNLILLIERTLASHYGGGVVTLLSLARTAVSLVGGVPGAVANAHFAGAMATSYENRIVGFTSWAAGVTRQTLLLAAPILLVFFLNIDAIVGFLFERGKFGVADRQAVAHLMFLYGLGAIQMILGGPVFKIFQMAHLDKALLCIVYSGVGIYAVLSYWLGGIWGGDGLVIAYSLSLNISIIALYLFLIWKFGIGIMDVPWVRLIVVSSVSWLVLSNLVTAISPWPSYFVRLVVVTTMVFAIFLGVAWIVNLAEMRSWLNVKLKLVTEKFRNL